MHKHCLSAAGVISSYSVLLSVFSYSNSYFRCHFSLTHTQHAKALYIGTLLLYSDMKKPQHPVKQLRLSGTGATSAS